MPGPDWYSIPVILVGIATAALGFAVYSSERASRLGARYLIFAISVSTYGVAAGVSYTISSAELALIWDRIAHLGVAFIPATLLCASITILGRAPTYRYWNSFALFVSGLFALLVLTTDHFVAGNELVVWGERLAYYPRYGAAGYPFLIYFAAVMAVVLVHYTRVIRETEDSLHRRRLRITRVALAIGCIGAVDFLPAVGVPLYPFGYLPILVFVAIMAFAIVRYRLVDITPELAASTILKTMESAVIVVDTSGVVRLANSAAQQILGFPESQVIDHRLSAGLSQIREAKADRPVERDWISPNGTLRTVSITASDLRHASGRLLGTIYVAHDISDRKRAEEELQRLALHDVLTGLPNRALFFDRLESVIARAERFSHRVALLYVDLDGFKEINDSLGHEAGDSVLRTTATRLLSSVRASDTVARIGGDEFVIICPQVDNDRSAEGIADKIAEAVAPPIRLVGAKCEVGATVGVAHYPDDGIVPETLLSAADRRMYARKKSRRL